MKQKLATVAGGLMVALLAVSAAYSANFRGFRDALPPPATRLPVQQVSGGLEGAGSVDVSILRSSPWWDRVTTFSGNGSAITGTFSIDPSALQWRVGWTCEAGSLQVQPHRPSGEPIGQAPIDDDCPSEGIGLSIGVDEIELRVEATAEWELTIEQQLDLPLVEPPTPEMEAGELIATGELYPIERKGEGKLEVYRLRDGSLQMRLEDFYVSPNVDLEIEVSSLAEPRSTDGFFEAPHEHVAMVPITTGSINYDVPDTIDLDRWRSIVIWCEPLHIAYAAATLESVR